MLKKFFLEYSAKRDHWPAATVAAVFIILALIGYQAKDTTAPAVTADSQVTMLQETIAELEGEIESQSSSFAKLRIKASKWKQPPPGCEKCPCNTCCPEIELEVGGSGTTTGRGTASAGAATKLTATAAAAAEALPERRQFTLDLATTIPIATGGKFSAEFKQADFEVSAGLGRFSLAARWRPEDNEIRIGPRIRIIGR